MQHSANSLVDKSNMAFKNAMPGFYYVFCLIVQLLFTIYLAYAAFAGFAETKKLPSPLFVILILVSAALVMISVKALQKRVQFARLKSGSISIQTVLKTHDVLLSDCKQFQSNGNLSDFELITDDKTYQFNDERSKNGDFIQELEKQFAESRSSNESGSKGSVTNEYVTNEYVTNEYVTRHVKARIAFASILTAAIICGLCVIRDDFIWVVLGIAVLDLGMCFSFFKLIKKATIRDNELLLTTLTGAQITVDLAKAGSFRLSKNERQFEITVDGKGTYVGGVTMPDGAGLYRRLNQIVNTH